MAFSTFMQGNRSEFDQRNYSGEVLSNLCGYEMGLSTSFNKSFQDQATAKPLPSVPVLGSA